MTAEKDVTSARISRIYHDLYDVMEKKRNERDSGLNDSGAVDDEIQRGSSFRRH